MARKVYFAFHYQRDIWRVNQVRHTWVTKEDIEEAGYIDAADFEKVERQGEEAIKRWIDNQLEGTSVTVVLIGYETHNRKYVSYEIEQSYNRGNGLLGIYIHNLKDRNGMTDYKGDNPFDTWYITKNGQKIYFSQIYPTYDWVNDDGYNNIGDWIEAAAKKAGK
jgi:hypothetical protein